MFDGFDQTRLLAYIEGELTPDEATTLENELSGRPEVRAALDRRTAEWLTTPHAHCGDRTPAQAIEACRTRAPQISASLSVDGVRLGGSSHRLRNPANVPPQWVEPLLDAYRDDPSARAPRAVSLDARRRGYVEPISVQPLCLTCHGEDIAQPVRERLAEVYPEDRATGFRTGDFRGMFWAEFPDPAEFPGPG